MLRLEGVTLEVGASTLLEDATLHVREGDRLALVGRNGAGKTSLLRLMMGQLDPSAGKVHRRGGLSIGWLPQQAVSGSSETVWAEARSGMTKMLALEAGYEAAQAAVAAGEPGSAERLDRMTEQMRHRGGFALDEKVGGVLHGLGFAAASWERSCDTFSGGWQMRIALARLLLSDADLLLLDEPTNHLDLTARSWLAGHLGQLDATLVLVSHDRHLLEQVTTATAEIRHRTLTRFAGTWSAWRAERDRRDADAAATRARQDAEVARLERFVDRFGAKATKAKQAASKRKALERIELVEVASAEKDARLGLPEAPPSARDVVELRDVALGWGDEPVIGGVEIAVERGQRWALLGPNGAGKSTLLHGLSGRLAPKAGRRILGRDVRAAVYAQDVAADLPGDVSALDHLSVHAAAASPQRIRTVLGALGLSGDAALRPISALSGGEKARVVLAGLVLRPANLLLLDEPTNHLDVETTEALADALDAWDGALVLVTHDRWLVERLATHVARVVDGRVETHLGVRPEDLDPIAASRASQEASGEVSSGKAHQEARKARRRTEARLAKLMTEADDVGARIEALDAQLFEHAADVDKALELGAQRTAAEERLEALFEEMATLEAALED